jgi:HSP20 family protein
MAEAERQLTRWDPLRDLVLEHRLPFHDFGALQTRLARMMDEILRERTRLPTLTSPPIDVTETDGSYVVTAEVPGVKRDDLTVECKDGAITIRGEKKSEREETREKARLLERAYGAFSRSLTLPSDADVERMNASFKEGVLRIEVQKKPEAKAKTVAIKS